MKYDVDELWAAVEKVTPGIWSWEDGPPTVYAGRAGGPFPAHGYNLLGRLEPDRNGAANLDAIVALMNAARAGLLDDATLGRAVLPLLDEHIKQAQLAVSERANWSIAQGEWSRARDALLNFRDALVAMKERGK